MHISDSCACMHAWIKLKMCMKPQNRSIFISYFDDQILRSLLLLEMGRARTFWAGVRACTLQTFSKFESNLRIGQSLFPILVTKLSGGSFYEKLAVHARFGLACTHARSKHFQNLRATLELVHLHFLFWWPTSQVTPSMRKVSNTRTHGRTDGHAALCI